MSTPRFAAHAPGPGVATSDGGHVGGETNDSTDSDESDDSRGLDPRGREHVEQHGSPAHSYDHAPDRSEPADFGHGESTGVQQL